MDAFLTNQNCSLTTIVDIIYPIGSIYLSINPTPPPTIVWRGMGTNKRQVSIIGRGHICGRERGRRGNAYADGGGDARTQT